MHSAKPHLNQRRAGVLLHITSLPGAGETGDLGSSARHFVDFLQNSGLTLWQTLPIGPTQNDGSPYQSTSAYAGNPCLISLEPLVAKGWLSGDVLEQASHSEADKCAAISVAWQAFSQQADQSDRAALSSFKEEHKAWLDDYLLFQALHDEYCCGWWEWPPELRHHEPNAIAKAAARLANEIDYLCFEQFLFFSQWMELKQYANERGVLLFGDMPIFVAHDSAEVWSHQSLFFLDGEGHPTVVAGVPPDCFSELGQRWGNPLYRWDLMQENGFAFWVARIKTQLQLFDLIRIDHFRGFEAYWEIPAEEENAVKGRWVKAPGDALFEQLHEAYDPLPLVAEDLGVITSEVDALRMKYQLPGMKILQFAFSGEADNPYLPFNHTVNSVVYTGTHDNDTSLGWYLSLDSETRQYVDEYLGRSQEIMPWPLIRCALASCAQIAILPMQDLLALDGNHRMNLPGTVEGNWHWRFDWKQVEPDLAARLYRRVKMYGRLIT